MFHTKRMDVRNQRLIAKMTARIPVKLLTHLKQTKKANSNDKISHVIYNEI